MPDIRLATADDVPAVGATLAAAFDGDPVMGWLASPKAHWATDAARFFAAEAAVQVRGHGEVLVDDQIRGAAVWSPPKRWKSTAREGVQMAVPSMRLFRSQVVRGVRALAQLEKVHPTEPHWYLAVIGTDPAHQGTGVGGALITSVTDRCDRDGTAAYLESSKEANVAYYARHGFEVTERVELRDGPPLWLMWREPRST